MVTPVLSKTKASERYCSGPSYIGGSAVESMARTSWNDLAAGVLACYGCTAALRHLETRRPWRSARWGRLFVRIWRSASANQSIVAPPDYLGDRNPLELIQSIIVVSTAT